MLNNLNTFSEFETFLGGSKNGKGLFSFETLLELDKHERYPIEQIEALNNRNLNRFFIPAANGGDLIQLEDLLTLMRLVARRDLTSAIAYGGTFLGAITIWIAGSDELKNKVAADIKANKKIAFAITEKKRGSDLLAIDLTATFLNGAGGYLLDGEKWLFNHASKSNYTTTLVKNSNKTGPRSCSLLYMPGLGGTGVAGNSSIKKLNRIHTVGLKGLDLGGISLNKHFVDDKFLIGKEGEGLELALVGLQVTKTLCSGLSLGSLDTLLRATVQFCKERILYSRPIIDIPIVKTKLVNAFLDLLMAEAHCIVTCRCAHVLPTQMGLFSALVKAQVPSLVEFHTKELSSLLGARSYVNNETEHAIFQKQARDNAIISIFEGNTYVNYQYALQQMKVIFSLFASKQPVSPSVLQNIYNLDNKLNPIDFSKLSVVGKGRDDLIYSLTMLDEDLKQEQVSVDGHSDHEEALKAISKLILLTDDLRDRFLAENPLLTNPFVINAEVFEYAYKYAKVHSIIATASLIYYNRESLNPVFTWLKLLKFCLQKSLSAFANRPYQPEAQDLDELESYLSGCYDRSSLFSLFPLKIA